jgi:peptide chain release factor subunit 1
VQEYSGNIKKYHCGRDILLIPEEYAQETFIVITMDAKECTIAKVGKEFEIVFHKTSLVPSKQDAGGQSQRRFEQNRENILVWWLKEVADNLRLLSGNYKILLGGCSNTKSKMRKYLSQNVDRRIVSEVDVGYTDEAGIWEVLDKSREDVLHSSIMEEKLMGDEFAKLLATNPEKVDYGANFDRENVRLILLSVKNKGMFPDLPTKVVRHNVIDALGICVFKKY